MDSLPGETEDSRTSEVGRKRDLTAFSLPEIPSTDYSDDSPERSHKRARQVLENGPRESFAEEVIVNTSAPPQIDNPSTAGPQLAATDQPPATMALQAITWNRGVQSGLRTSFGSRGPSLTKSSTPVPEAREVDTIMSGMEMGPQTGASQPTLGGGPSSNLHDVVEITPPAKPEPEHIESTMPKGKNARKKKPQTSDSDTIGVKAATGRLTRSSAAQAAKDQQFPRLLQPGIKRVYENGRGEFVLNEILQDNKHIGLEDLSAEVFVHHFLATNSQKLDSLSSKHIKGAFSKYISLYYNHLPTQDLAKARSAASNLPTRVLFGKVLAQAKKSAQENRTIGEPTNSSKADALTQPKKVVQENITIGESTNSAKADALTQPTKAAQENRPIGGSTNSSKAEPDGPGSLGVERLGSLKESDNGASSISRLPPADTNHTPSSKDATHSAVLFSPESDREEGEMSSYALDVALSDLEIELLQRYFPTAAGSVTGPRCLACSGSSHKTFDCPALTCNICDRNHLVFTCPNNIRCLKCRARGHHTNECPEKLLCAPSEASGCDLCQSKDHLENACHMIWRSYNPMPEEIRTVREIPVSCYVCGASNHYGPECGLHNGKILSGGVTWSKRNLQKYLDPSSSDRAIAAGTDFSLPPPSKKSFNIKGQASDPIMLDDSDDDVEFIRPSVKPSSSKSQPPGTNQHIRFAQNRAPVVESLHRTPKPPRQSRPQSDNNAGFQNSARYGRERTFSPPPRYDDFRAGFNENNRYLPQGPTRGEYRPSDGGRRTGPGDNSFRGGPPRRGRGPVPARGGGNGRGKKRGKNSK